MDLPPSAVSQNDPSRPDISPDRELHSYSKNGITPANFGDEAQLPSQQNYKPLTNQSARLVYIPKPLLCPVLSVARTRADSSRVTYCFRISAERPIHFRFLRLTEVPN